MKYDEFTYTKGNYAAFSYLSWLASVQPVSIFLTKLSAVSGQSPTQIVDQSGIEHSVFMVSITMKQMIIAISKRTRPLVIDDIVTGSRIAIALEGTLVTSHLEPPIFAFPAS